MKKFLIALCVGAGLLCLPVLAQTQDVTPEELRANPKNYDGKTVRLRGQVDNCTPQSCNICNLEMTRASRQGACVGLEFEGFSGIPSSRLQSASGQMEEAFRFATVTLTAKFDASCAPGGTRTCTDQRLLLAGARVESVQGRKNALNGLITADDYGAVSAPSSADSRAMLAELRSHGDFANMEIAAFRVPDNIYLKDGGIGCFCTADTCKDKWPNRYFGGFDSPANPFRCYEMQKIKGVWRVLLH